MLNATIRRASLLWALILLFACGSNPNAPGENGNVSGTWVGTYSSAQLGSGQATLSLIQSGSSLSGTWSTARDSGGSIGAGTVSGSNMVTSDSGSFGLDLAPSDPTRCPFRATVTYSLPQKQMTGQWVTVNCTVAATGGLNLSKR